MNDRKLAIALFALLERENKISVPQIAKLLGSDEETILELLNELIFAYDSVDLRLDVGGAHATLQRWGKTRILRLNEQETAALLDALEAYGFDRESELATKLVRSKSLFEGDFDDAEEGGRMRTVPQGVDAGIAERVAFACEDEAHHVLQIEYQKEGADCPEVRNVEPRLIVSDGDRSTLEAYDQARAGWRSFRLDRIKSARILADVFEEKAYEDARDTQWARVRFSPGAMPSDWPGLKRVRELEDGGCEAKIPWYGSLWLPKQIVAMLGRAQPLEPAELREQCASYAAALLRDI